MISKNYWRYLMINHQSFKDSKKGDAFAFLQLDINLFIFSFFILFPIANIFLQLTLVVLMFLQCKCVLQLIVCSLFWAKKRAIKVFFKNPISPVDYFSKDAWNLRWMRLITNLFQIIKTMQIFIVWDVQQFRKHCSYIWLIL